MEAAFKAAHELYEEEASKNPAFKTLYEPWKKFRSEEYQWFRIAEATFANFMYSQKLQGRLGGQERLAPIAFLRGASVELNLAPVMLKRLTITGSTLRARPVAEKAPIARAFRERVWPLLEAGKIKPVIHQTFPLHEAAPPIG